MSTAGVVPDAGQSLDDWLLWLETIHPVSIDMGLDRVSKVAQRLHLLPARKSMILVGGTNGKGSTVGMLSSIYSAAGYKVGAYTSPHIEHFCERIRCNDQMVDQQTVVEALAFVERGRAPETLTYFEYTTLAAMRVFDVLDCDVLLFEVGLGGRLDATNIWDADCSIITSIALDHESYLGSDVSVIATEKAAIGRTGKPFIVGAVQAPESLARYAAKHGFDLIDVGSRPLSSLPETSMHGDYQRRNAACALEAVARLQQILPVEPEISRQALKQTSVPGRFESLVVDGVQIILDVAHNPAGAAALVETWKSLYPSQRCNLLLATLADKDIAGVVSALSSIVSTWHVLALDVPRAATSAELASIVGSHCANSVVIEHTNIGIALNQLISQARVTDEPVLVAGSFYTIAAAKAELRNSH